MDLLILTTEKMLTPDQRDRAKEMTTAMGKSLGLAVVLLDSGTKGHVERDLSSLVAALTAQTEMIGRLVLALADADSDEPEAPQTYMDGTPV